ncbi:MAG: hypothetical protein AAF960_16290 [Bacteroidota bacterium]
MQDIEPYYRWRDKYIASNDRRSPFYGRSYSEFHYTNKIYNYYIHPQWDEFGSSTLYTKILFLDYDKGYAILEFIGEWNDALHNDIMILKRNLLEPLMDKGIYKFVLICENVLTFHGGEDDYYEEWGEEVRDEGGWICFLNVSNHVEDEMKESRLQYHVNFGEYYNELNWRPHKPTLLFEVVEALVNGDIRRLV